MARNSFYDGSPGDTVTIDNSVIAAESAETSSIAAKIASLAAQVAAESSAASALSSKNSVEDIIPIGGSEDSILTKLSSSNYDLVWTSNLEAINVDGGYF